MTLQRVIDCRIEEKYKKIYNSLHIASESFLLNEVVVGSKSDCTNLPHVCEVSDCLESEPDTS